MSTSSSGEGRPGVDPRSEEQKQQQKILRENLSHIRHKVLVLSGKGGVGKSTVAAGMAIALAKAGKRVGLMDVDVHGPSIPKLLGIEEGRVGLVAERMKPVTVGENLSVMSVGFFLKRSEDAVIWRGPLKMQLIRQFLAEVDWGELDYLVVDSPPGTGDEPLSVVQLLGNADGAVVVTTPQELALSDVRRCIGFCRQLGLPVLGIVENMDGLVCPHCGKTVDLFKRGGGEDLAQQMGLPLLASVPMDPTVVEACDAGRLHEVISGDGPVGKALSGVAAQLPGVGKPTESRRSSAEEGSGLKIAIPLAEGKLSMHFGHCQEFALVEVDVEGKKIASIERLQPPAHEPGVLPKWLHDQGANLIIASGMGQRAQQLFSQAGIEVVIGAASDTPEAVVQAYLAGTLATGDNICDH